MVRRDYPFTDYASSFWPQHAKACEQDQATQDLVLEFLTNQQAFQTWILVFEPDDGYIYQFHWPCRHEMRLSSSAIEIPSPLQAAAAFGLSKPVRAFLASSASHSELSQPSDCDKYDHHFFQAFYTKGFPYKPEVPRSGLVMRASPLHIAACHGRQDTVELLRDNGLSLHDAAGPEGSSFTVACCDGHDELVAGLIATDAHCSHSFSGAMHAFVHGRWKVLRTLLNAGSPIPPDDFEFHDLGFDSMVIVDFAGRHRLTQGPLPAIEQLRCTGGRSTEAV